MQPHTNTPVATSIKIPGSLRARIQSLAEVRKRTPHSLMLQALENFVTREEKRESWRQAGITAWEDYQRTGLHLTGDEVNEWLAKVAAGERPEMPKCHL